MILDKIDYNVPRAEDTILIDTDNWVENKSNLVHRFSMSGKSIINYMTTVYAKNVTDKFKLIEDCVDIGDTVLLSRVASDICRYRAYPLERDGAKYYNIPLSQIIGVFVDNIFSLDNLQVFYDKLIIKRVEIPKGVIQTTVNDYSMIGEVIKVGEGGDHKVKVGDTILIRDNMVTEFSLSNNIYYALDENSVVGIFREGKLSLDSLDVINNYLIMNEYQTDNSFGGTIASVYINPEYCDYSDFYNRDLFMIFYKDKDVKQVDIMDLVFICRDLVNYLFFDGVRYFVTNDLKYLEAKIKL